MDCLSERVNKNRREEGEPRFSSKKRLILFFVAMAGSFIKYNNSFQVFMRITI
jgi:hypothetical protein